MHGLITVTFQQDSETSYIHSWPYNSYFPASLRKKSHAWPYNSHIPASLGDKSHQFMALQLSRSCQSQRQVTRMALE